MGALLFALVAVAIQGLLFWRTTDGRIADSKRKDTAAFGFAWGLVHAVVCHLAFAERCSEIHVRRLGPVPYS